MMTSTARRRPPGCPPARPWRQARARWPAVPPYASRSPGLYVAQAGAETSSLKSTGCSEGMARATPDRARATKGMPEAQWGHQAAKLRFVDNWMPNRTTSAFAQLILAQTCNRATSCLFKVWEGCSKIKGNYCEVREGCSI